MAQLLTAVAGETIVIAGKSTDIRLKLIYKLVLLAGLGHGDVWCDWVGLASS